MNEHKICFIYCVNDKKLYEESVRYVQHLHIPEGYSTEIISIEDAPSMCSGYNRAMAQTDAKYKVFLHQDVFIINRNFIKEVIDLFKENEKLGLLGVVGSKTIPYSGVWWESEQKTGKVFDSHTGKMDLLQFDNIFNSYELVRAIDGLIMITQYDIPWREDLFDGWHYYDLSQCQEFILSNLEVGVIKQDLPWCIHDCGIVNIKNGFSESKNRFLDYYFDKGSYHQTLPLVSVLIPAYNRPKLLKEAIESAIKQSYPNIEIIVSDDSTNDDVNEMLKPYLKKYANIKYYRNIPSLGVENFDHIFELAKGEYINFLMDDDLFHPFKIEKMSKYILNNRDITLVTSHRQRIDEKGNYLPDDLATKRMFEKDTVLDGILLGDYVLKNNLNIIGEPTTVLFRKTDLTDKFGFIKEKRLSVINDLTTWILLLSKGKAVYIAETLSYFRQHEGQNQRSLEFMKLNTKHWVHLLKNVRELGFLKSEIDYKTALNKVLSSNPWIFQHYIDSSNTSLLSDNGETLNALNFIYKEIGL